MVQLLYLMSGYRNHCQHTWSCTTHDALRTTDEKYFVLVARTTMNDLQLYHTQRQQWFTVPFFGSTSMWDIKFNFYRVAKLGPDSS